MDDRRFDDLARSLAAGPASRRAALRLLAGLALGTPLGLLGPTGAAACTAVGGRCNLAKPGRCCSKKCSKRGKCLCAQASQRPCYTGPAGTEGVGACQGGTQSCGNNGAWGPCQGQTLPLPEVCDGLDNDCDGVADNGNPGGGATCSTGQLGICADGTSVCRNGVIECDPHRQPEDEVQDNQDNDCDGSTDEGP